jgi:hypothetical protein
VGFSIKRPIFSESLADDNALKMEGLEDERDKLARQHYLLRRNNMRATALIDGIQESFQTFHDKQTKTASSIFEFADKLREEHRIMKEEMSTKIE